MIERDRPRLRELQIRQLERDGVELVQVVDPLGIGPGRLAQPWFISKDEWRVAQLLDGRRTADDIGAELAEAGLADAFISRTITALSQRFVLDDEVFEEELFRQLDAFRSQTQRNLVGSGREYTSDNIDLRIQLGGIVANDWDMPEIPLLQGMLLPASSFGAAARLYARGYAALRHQVSKIDRIVLLGTADAKLGRLLVPLTLPSKSAFGISPLDADGLRALSIVPGRDEIAHRDSLVIERHQLFTTLLTPKTPVLPILVGQIGDLNDPAVEADVSNAVSALQRVQSLPGHTLIITACDLGRLTPTKTGISSRDLRTLDADLSDVATRLDSQAFLQAARSTDDPALSRSPAAAYLLLRVLEATKSKSPGLRGAVAGYLQMKSDAHLTSAASLTFFED